MREKFIQALRHVRPHLARAGGAVAIFAGGFVAGWYTADARSLWYHLF